MARKLNKGFALRVEDPDPAHRTGSGSLASLQALYVDTYLIFEVTVAVLDQLLEEANKNDIRRNAVADQLVQSSAHLFAKDFKQVSNLGRYLIIVGTGAQNTARQVPIFDRHIWTHLTKKIKTVWKNVGTYLMKIYANDPKLSEQSELISGPE